jgi:Flp pilus assembly protein TadB
MSANALRAWLIAVLGLAAVLSVVSKKLHSPLVGQVGIAVVLGALALYVTWRRAAIKERRGRVLDPEAKTPDADRTRSDK